MNRYILDTNVTIAWYLPEVFSEPARFWQQQLLESKISLVVPGLHYWEFSNVLRTLVLRKEISSELASSIYELHLKAPLVILEPEKAHILKTALTYQATSYDAVYIQLGLSTGYPLITAEKKSRYWVKKLDSRVITLE